MKEIPLTQGQVAIVDDGDYEELSKYKWCAANSHHKGIYYAVRAIRINGKKTTIGMHSQILSLPRGREGDHWNHNGLDNRRKNLRPCTYSQNQGNQKVYRRTHSSIYKGVNWNKASSKWHATLRKDYHKYHLGYFVNEESAARAYDAAAREHFGEFACTNFGVVT